MKRVALTLVCVAVALGAGEARAEKPEQTYAAAVSALKKGAATDAIDRLELLADQGVLSHGASLARAAAYLARADGGSAQPGDLGRAVAALSEALALEPNDAEAEHALEAVQAEIARRKSKSQESVLVRPRLSRAIATLVPEQVWAVLAALSALAVTLGVFLRRWSTKPFGRLSGITAIAVGAVLLLGFGAGAYAAEGLRTGSQAAVVVVPEARLTNDAGRPLPFKRGADTTTVPEGATVYVRQRREGRCLVEWGSTDGWLSLSDVRLIPTQ